MPKRIAVDAGPLIALFDQSDIDHQRSLEFFASWKGRGFVTTAVIAETAHLLSFHTEAMLDFLRWLQKGAFDVEDVGGDLGRIVELMEKYRDVPMDFADATVVAACERLNVQHVATLDGDFTVYRFQRKMPFHNVFPL